ncbi:MAG TPA: cell shape-determining protein MreB [Cytophagales bacterium]|jgi:hypothetical protein|nr:cell shape-determining protein MreB [Cytophagales bacterium]
MRKIQLLFTVSVLAVMLFVQSCTKKEEITLPTITSFTPSSGLPGSTITITGTNFSATPSLNLVMVAGTQANVTAATATSITATVSANAQVNTAGKVTVTAGGLTAVSSSDFTVTAIPPTPTTTVTGEITADTHWTADMHILLSGYVYVTDGHTLTIDAGTIIKGDKATKGALIIEPGAKIVAVGTADKPIIFTSNQPLGQRNYGDWGGVILCGKAKTNWVSAAYTDGLTHTGSVPVGQGQVEGGPRTIYGGSDDTDNSGTMQYCRIEFGGVAFSQDNEINGLTLCAVGSGTTIDHIQVSFAGDDSYEWFGGAVNAKYLIAHRGLDDDFDTDNGFQGKVQFAVGLRDPNVADQSGSKGFESDSYQGTAKFNASTNNRPTAPLFANVTLVGGVTSPTSTSYDPQFVSGIHLRKGSQLQTANSVIVAHPVGILISNEIGQTNQSYYDLNSAGNGEALVDVIKIQNVIVGGIPTSRTRLAYGILPLNSAATASQDLNVAVVTNNIRSRTPITTITDSTNNAVAYNSFFTSTTGGTSYTDRYSWLGGNIYYNLTVNNRFYYTEQSGVRLVAPFNLTNPDFFPSSSSPIQVGLGGGTGAGITASGPAPAGSQASPVSPQVSPSWTGSFSDSFFTQVTYIGAFGYGGTNWTTGWANWDPNNADYGDPY